MALPTKPDIWLSPGDKTNLLKWMSVVADAYGPLGRAALRYVIKELAK